MMACILLNVYGGCALLALSQARHWRRAGYTSAVPRASLRGAAVALLAATLLLCVAAEGLGFGMLLWVLSLSAAAVAVALTLAWWPLAFAPPRVFIASAERRPMPFIGSGGEERS